MLSFMSVYKAHKYFQSQERDAEEKLHVNLYCVKIMLQKDEQSFDHQLPTMPSSLPDPETVPKISLH